MPSTTTLAACQAYVVTLLEEAAFNGRPFQIGMIFVHSANPSGAETVVRVLKRWDHRVRRATA